MTYTGVYAPTVAPPAQPRLLNLLTSARLPADDTAGRWTSGFAFAPENCAPGGVRDICDAASTFTAQSNQTQVSTVPYVVWSVDQCTTLGFASRDYLGRATRLLDAQTPKQVEAEFWTGTLAAAAGWPNLYLAAAGATDLTPGTVPSRGRAIEILEQYLADCGYGARGMIHLRPADAPIIGYVRRVGNLLLTNLDTIVVPGVGYPNTGPGGSTPAAGTGWMYATGLVDVRLSDPVLIPGGQEGAGAFPSGRVGTLAPGEPVPAAAVPGGEPSDWIRWAMDRGVNQITVRAERMAAATWDGCCLGAVRFTLDS